MNGPGLPTLLRMIADAAGIDAAVAAARSLGGKRVYIRSEPRPSDPLVLAVGLEMAAKIGAAVGGEAVEFPKGEAAIRFMLAKELTKRGASANEMVTILKTTYRWARELRRRALEGEATKVAHRPRHVAEQQLDIEAYLRQR